MNCDVVQPRLTALLDGELPPEIAAESERHLAACPVCTQVRADLAAVREAVSAWEMDTPDIRACVMQAVADDNQHALLDEMRLLRSELEALRTEVAALRRQLTVRGDAPWTPPARLDYRGMENDPWNLVRS